jgi:hypothetical protein
MPENEISMAEEQKQENKSVPADPGYYKDTGSKVTDFLFGFFGYPIIMSLAQLAFGPRRPMWSGIQTWVTAVISLVLTITFVVFAYKRGRKFLAIGIISVLIIPLIAAGSCLLIFMAIAKH